MVFRAIVPVNAGTDVLGGCRTAAGGLRDATCIGAALPSVMRKVIAHGLAEQ